MALQQSYTTEAGIPLVAAYCHLDMLEFDYAAERVQITVRRYASRDDKLAGAKSLTGQDKFYIELSGADYLAWFGPKVLETLGVTPQSQAYTYLKTRPEFANATDVIEAVQP